jgi:raffinose/stachyose/melibiose transport system permease protein
MMASGISSPATGPAPLQAEAHPTTRGTSGTRRLRRTALPYLFILPTMVLLIVFMYYPAFTALYRSFYTWDGIGTPVFNGLGNFRAMFGDQIMQQAFVNVLKLTVFAMTVQVIVPLLVARLILAVRGSRAQYIIRVLFVIPLVVPQVVFLNVWGFFYDPQDGLINQALTALHLDNLTQSWLGDPSLALYCIIFIWFPFVDGFALLIYTAGFQAISAEVVQAAAVDGAGPWSRFLRIELPLVLGQVRLIVVLNMIWALQSYTSVLILTQGGPGTATYVPGLVLYASAFQNRQMGYACAIGVVLFLIMLALTFINLKYLRSRTDYEPERVGA